MSESPVPITTGSGSASIASDLVSGNNYQQIKVVDATIGSNNAWKVNSDGSAQVSVFGTVLITGSVQSGTVGASIVGQLPAGTAPIGSIATLQGTVPWIISSVYGNVSGSVVSFQGTNPWVVGSVVTIYAPVASLVSGVTSVITGTSSVQVLAPAAGGQRNYITQVLATNAAAVGTFVNLYDGGNIIYAGYAAASGGGFSISFPSPLRQSSVAGNLSALTPTQASVVVSASGYTAP